MLFDFLAASRAIGFTYVWPYNALVGCSSGIYALLGCCCSHVIINSDILPIYTTIILALITSLELFIGLLYYLLWYDATVAHAAHAAGFVAGFTVRS